MKSLLKVILLGDCGVGKTSLMYSYAHGSLIQNYKSTIGADFITKDVEVDGRNVMMQIWDTSGQERFQSLGAAYYRGADSCVLVFDMSNPTSFNSLDGWRSEFLLQSSPKNPESFPFVVLGNKVDLDDNVISEQMLVGWCRENKNIPYYITSAKNGSNVEEAFKTIVKCAYENDSSVFTDGESYTEPDRVRIENTVPGKKNCC